MPGSAKLVRGVLIAKLVLIVLAVALLIFLPSFPTGEPDSAVHTFTSGILAYVGTDQPLDTLAAYTFGRSLFTLIGSVLAILAINRCGQVQLNVGLVLVLCGSFAGPVSVLDSRLVTLLLISIAVFSGSFKLYMRLGPNPPPQPFSLDSPKR